LGAAGLNAQRRDETANMPTTNKSARNRDIGDPSINVPARDCQQQHGADTSFYWPVPVEPGVEPVPEEPVPMEPAPVSAPVPVVEFPVPVLSQVPVDEVVP